MTGVVWVLIVALGVMVLLFMMAMAGVDKQKDLKEQYRQAYQDESNRAEYRFKQSQALSKRLDACVNGTATILPTGVSPMDIFRAAKAAGADIEVVDMSDLDSARHIGHIKWNGEEL